MENILGWIMVLTCSVSLALAREFAVNPGLMLAMKRNNLKQVFGPEVLAHAPVHDESWGYGLTQNNVPFDSIQFVLYSSDNKTKEQLIDVRPKNRQLLGRGFDRNAPTKIICHGYMSDYLKGPGYQLRRAYFKAYKSVNVIVINWATLAGVYTTRPKGNALRSQGLSDIFYFPPAHNTELVGNATAELVKLLIRDAGLRLSDIHLVGHSLGAHAMGFAGLALHQGLKEKVGRITVYCAIRHHCRVFFRIHPALDPAGPCFESWYVICFEGNYRSIQKTDAVFVDVIHTHGRAFGMVNPVGHVDFYPNGGWSQPGCAWWTFGICSHRRAIDLMADSIEFGMTKPGKKKLQARNCTNWDNCAKHHWKNTVTSEMGEFCPAKSRGNYYLSIQPNGLNRLYQLFSQRYSAYDWSPKTENVI